MKLSSIILSAVLTVAAMAVPASRVHAANITIKGGTCHALQFLPTPVPEPLHFSSGSIANPTGDSSYSVVCDVPREPLALNAAAGGFYVDGTNFPGQSTTCSIESFNYNGFFMGLVVFTESASTYDHFVSLPASQLGTWAYVALNCSLPANGFGSLIGVTSVQ
ncbi:MAG TPA: hypothetical protein VKB34_20230 [Povalibacter sp.]|nr:hypothetical protein [Povalibacter sp.]